MRLSKGSFFLTAGLCRDPRRLDSHAGLTPNSSMTTAFHSPTLDPAEVDRFRKLADDWWDPKGRMRPLHEIAPTRLGYIRAEACRHFGRDVRAMRALDGLSVLDIGCAVGLVAEPVARMGSRVTGIDPGAELIAAARAHAGTSSLAIDYRNARAEDLAAASETFDMVLCLEVVEHVPDVGAFLATCGKLVAPGGLMIVSTINRTLKAFALAIVGAEYVLRWLPRGTHEWSRFVTPDELAGHFRAGGLVPGKPRGMMFNPLAAGWSLSSDSDVNYFLSAAKPNAVVPP